MRCRLLPCWFLDSEVTVVPFFPVPRVLGFRHNHWWLLVYSRELGSYKVPHPVAGFLFFVPDESFVYRVETGLHTCERRLLHAEALLRMSQVLTFE